MFVYVCAFHQHAAQPDSVLVADGDAGEGHLGDVVLFHADVLLELAKLVDAIADVEDEDADRDAHQQQPEDPAAVNV